MKNIVKGTYSVFDVRAEGTRVVFLKNGQEVFVLPWDAAEEIAKAIFSKVKVAEEIAKADQIVKDGAILLRSGAPFGITDNVSIRSEIEKEAAWNSDLRRYMPGGIKSQEHLGTPAVIKHKPKR